MSKIYENYLEEKNKQDHFNEQEARHLETKYVHGLHNIKKLYGSEDDYNHRVLNPLGGGSPWDRNPLDN